MINVDFVFNAPSDIDFDALKRLFIQLFYTHAPKLDTGAIADFIIKASKEQQLGTVIKVQDDEDNDPFAVVSAAEVSVSASGRRPYLEALVNNYFYTVRLARQHLPDHQGAARMPSKQVAFAQLAQQRGQVSGIRRKGIGADSSRKDDQHATSSCSAALYPAQRGACREKGELPADLIPRVPLTRGPRRAR